MSDDNPARFRWLLSVWRDDLEANHSILQPGFQAVAVHRFGVWSLQQKGLTRWLSSKTYVLAYLFMRNVYGVDLPRRASVGRRLRLPHPVGVVVHAQARIGDDCLIRQNVTIGQFNYGRRRQPPFAPRLGDGVWVGAGAVVVGGISIGNGARIGPNAVVMRDVPEGGFVFAREAATTRPLRRERMDKLDDAQPAGQFDSGDGEAPRGLELAPDNSRAVKELIELIGSVTDPDEAIEPDTPLLSTGIIDSFDVVALLTAIEDRFGVAINPEEVDIDWFDTPSQILNRINSGST